MGLDMYLDRRIYVKNWDHMDDDKKHEVVVKRGGELREDINTEKVKEVIEEVGYWRKANHIHRWFIKNCADGIDDCREMYVSESQLKKLYEICENVLTESLLVPGYVANGKFADKSTDYVLTDNIEIGKVIKDYSYAAEHLPTKPGFFFGSTDYDEYYYAKVLETIKILDSVIDENGNFLEGDYYYTASW